MSSPPPPYRHHITAVHLIPPLIATVITLSLLLFIFLLLRHLRRHFSAVKPSLSTFPRRFSYSTLHRATSSFSTSRRLGHGGSGVVFSGTLTLTLNPNPNSKLPIAVKLINSGSLQGEREFHNEITLANNLVDSDRIVKLLGFATSRKKRRLCLVYELMANGNLQDCLLIRKCEELMEWSHRFRIVLEVAQGLVFLHHQCDPPIIHGDIKPSNVLLDGDFRAKIGDFGLARLKLVENCADHDNVVVNIGDQSPEMVTAPGSPLEFVDVESDFESQSDVGQEVVNAENEEVSKPQKVKDYVIEWIGTEVEKQRPLSSWLGGSSSEAIATPGRAEKKKGKKGFKWWCSMIDGRIAKKAKRREGVEWWKEEYSEELEKKKMKKMSNKERHWWPRNDLWFDGYSSDLSKARVQAQAQAQAQAGAQLASYDSMSGEIPKSGGISSTPSTRGTVCYIAPEYSSGGDLSEKCDVYSFGVLLLVVIAGRRPLQVTDSPMSEFHRANLLSWVRQLARAGKLLDLVDEKIRSLNKEQARMCITVALLCLQKAPTRRPSMKEIVGMLIGELDLPQLPKEYSPYPFKSRKKLW